MFFKEHNALFHFKNNWIHSTVAGLPYQDTTYRSLSVLKNNISLDPIHFCADFNKGCPAQKTWRVSPITRADRTKQPCSDLKRCQSLPSSTSWPTYLKRFLYVAHGAQKRPPPLARSNLSEDQAHHCLVRISRTPPVAEQLQIRKFTVFASYFRFQGTTTLKLSLPLRLRCQPT